MEKWFAVTSKPRKEQTKREVNRILEGIVFKIIHPDYINQPGTISKANRSPRITSYAVVLQEEVEFEPNAQNIHLPPTGSNRQLKRNVVALYDTKIKNTSSCYNQKRKPKIRSKPTMTTTQS